MKIHSVAVLAACLNVGVAAAAQDMSDRLTPRDIFELEYASDPQISPNGERIVYVRTSMDIMTDKARGNLWTIEADGDNHRPLLSGTDGYSSPRWSPDGGRLAYVTGADGSAQIYVRWMDTGQTARVTNLTESPRNLSWSPDGDMIAFLMNVADSTEPLAKMPQKPEGAEWAPPVKVIDDVTYRVDGQGYLEPAHTHLFVVPADGGTPRQLTTGDYNHFGAPAWSADGETLYISANRNEDAALKPMGDEVFAIDLAAGGMRQVTDREGPDELAGISSDGRRLAVLGFDDEKQGYQVTRLEVMDTDGGNRRVLTDGLDRSVSDAKWVPGGRSLIISYDDEGVTKLAEVSLSGDVKTVAEHLGGQSLGRPYGGGDFSVARGSAVAFTVNSPTRPADVATLRRGETRRLTDLNEDLLAHKELGEVEMFWADSSADGRPVQSWLVKPPGFDASKKYPLILEIHGGPFANYGPRFSGEVQLYAAAGYVVLYSNPRGSTSYGGEFGNLIHHNYPSQDYDDLMSAVDAAIARGFVDQNNLFVTGGSGGGVLTAWIVGKTDRFNAAVVAKPVINWTSFVLTADFAPFFTQYWFPAMPWEDQDAYWQRSPLSLVGNVETPTMLLTGEADYRTPIAETEQYYQALKLRGIDTVMVRVPGASHGIYRRPSNLIAKTGHILAWFEKYKTEGAESVAAAGGE